jgi:hypothetical protein
MSAAKNQSFRPQTYQDQVGMKAFQQYQDQVGMKVFLAIPRPSWYKSFFDNTKTKLV